MKKFCAFLFVVLVAISFSACSAFYSDQTQTTPQDTPYTATIFLKVNNELTLTINQTELATKLSEWQGEINTLITQMALDENSTDPKITAVHFQDSISSDDSTTYTVELTLDNVPDNTLQKTVRPFKIYYHQTIYNPIALLPTSDTFTYIVGYSSQRRHSASNANYLSTDENGSYFYLWTTGEQLEFDDVYPNRPLYYLLVIAGAVIIGGLVYLISRHNDCKKTQKPL